MKSEFHAYEKEDPGLEAVMRFHAVKRWHMIDTTRAQTLAEHSANVALLAYYIAMRAPGMYFGPAANIAIIGLLHDLPEVFMGDIPTMTKPYLGKDRIHTLEHDLTPAAFRTELESPEVSHMIKLCDLADGIRFIRTHGIDVTARHAEEGLSIQFIDKLRAAKALWPVEVYEFVKHAVNFYAYEYR
jgi:5'-deoxynucleotidase YfbR-like HD superfamily hydrolase